MPAVLRRFVLPEHQIVTSIFPVCQHMKEQGKLSKRFDIMSDKITRRLFITALAAIAIPVPAMAEIQTMTVNQAYKAASKGEILFLDIRTPQEWQQTGIPEPAQPVSMHLKSFLTKLIKLTGGD